MKITILDGFTLNPGDNPWSPIEQVAKIVVHDRTPEELVVERARGSGIVLTNKTPLSAETIAQLPDLRYIGVLATGYNVVDVSAAKARGIIVTNVPEYGTDSVAQHTFALLLALIHAPERHDAAVRAGEWSERGDFSFWLAPMQELAGKTMGIVGYGRIGRQVGAIARAFGMTVVAYKLASNARVQPSASEDADRADTTEPAIFQPAKLESMFDDGTPWLSLEEIFSTSDVLTLHCPQTPENAGFINRGLLARMKPSAFLINTARGGLVNEHDLAKALAMRRLAGAAIDVASVEPIREDNPLLQAPNCLITPHMAWAAIEARRRLMQFAADNVRAFLDGRPKNVVS